LLDRHQTATERAELRAVRRVAAAYRQARQELTTALLDAWPGMVTTPEQARIVARQLALVQRIDERLLQLEREIGVILRDVVSVSSEQGLQQIESELALLPSDIRPTVSFADLNTRMIERFTPVALTEARLGTRALSLQLQRELQTGLIQGESFPDLVRRMMTTGVTPTGSSVWARGETSAMLSTRRTVITAENAAKQESLQETNRQIPEVRKQAIAAMGPTTTDCCLRVHGQIQPVDQPFVLVGTPRFADAMMAPAFHWNCRTSVTMWHPAFEDALPTSKLREAAQAELRKRR
jgi:hypothetical protein